MAERFSRLLGCAWLAFAAACVEVPKTGNGSRSDAGTAPSDAGTPPAADASATDTAPPTVVITAPAADAGFASSVSTVTVEGTAADDLGVAAVEVSVGPNAPVAAASDDFFRTWRATLPLPVGTSAIRATVTDVAGKTAAAEIAVSRAAANADTATPTLTIADPPDGTSTTRQSVVFSGTASDDTGLARVEFRVDGLTDFAVAETSDTFATWRASVGLAPGVENVVRVRATDIAGKSVELTRRVTSTTAADQDPPALTVQSPVDGASVATETVAVTGTASDTFGVASVDVKVGNGDYVTATTSSNFATWTAIVAVTPGANTLRVRATDGSGLETVTTLTVTSTFVPTFGTPRAYELRLAAPRDRTVSLLLNRTGLGEVIPESVRRSIVLLNVDPAPLMYNILETIKNSCGSGWQYRSFTPNCPSSWGAPERNMFRLLTMTPDNVNVAGTSIETTAKLANDLAGWGIIASFSDILADTLGISRYSPISDTTYGVAALKADLIQTHPNVNADGTLPITMQDGYTDMTELSTKFGPAGSHPGFLDSSATTYAKVLLDNFQMSVSGTSNLTWYDGVDLSKGKEYIAILPTPTSDVITFDFANTLNVTGLAANPVVSLTFKIREYNGFLRAHTRSNGSSSAPSQTPPGPGQMWYVSPWYVEYILADASYRQYKTRSHVKNYTFGFRIVVITVGANETQTPRKLPVLNPNPGGWARFWTIFGLGDPPNAQYLWEMIAEISQIRLRDGGVAEGDGTVRFQLTNIPVGLTGDQIKAQLRPSLEAQKSLLSQRLLGDYKKNNGAIDFYLKGTAGNLYLFFVDASDPLPSATYGYANPGFFADAALTRKVSTRSAGTSGDSVHEKLRLTAQPQTVYVKDNEGVIYKLDIDAAQSDRVTVRVSKKL